MCLGNGVSGSKQQAANCPYGWCCIIFVQRKMTAIALHAILHMTPALKFLKSAPFMGFGGTTSATSLNSKVRTLVQIPLWMEPWICAKSLSKSPCPEMEVTRMMAMIVGILKASTEDKSIATCSKLMGCTSKWSAQHTCSAVKIPLGLCFLAAADWLGYCAGTRRNFEAI